jgi:hypothetical protein
MIMIDDKIHLPIGQQYVKGLYVPPDENLTIMVWSGPDGGFFISIKTLKGDQLYRLQVAPSDMLQVERQNSQEANQMIRQVQDIVGCPGHENDE